MIDKTKQIEQTDIGMLLGMQSFSTIKYESKAIKKELQFDEPADEIKAINKRHLVKGKFDFIGVTVSEIVTFLCSTTSVLKQYQNNELNGLKESEIPLLVDDNDLIVSVRDMLDTTRTRVASTPSFVKTADKMKKDGASNEEIHAKLTELLKLYEAAK